jgi:hypothetical protein
VDIEILEDSGLWSWRGSTSKEIDLKNLAPLTPCVPRCMLTKNIFYYVTSYELKTHSIQQIKHIFLCYLV